MDSAQVTRGAANWKVKQIIPETKSKNRFTMPTLFSQCWVAAADIRSGTPNQASARAHRTSLQTVFNTDCEFALPKSPFPKNRPPVDSIS
jgi:hypothetical protein